MTGTLESIFGAPAADTASEEYAQGETAAAVAAFLTPGPGGKLGLARTVTGHAAKRLATREAHVTAKMISKATTKGQRYYDPKNKSINFILRGGFASGKDLLVGRNPFTGEITTVLSGYNLTRPRMIPIP